jgi:aldehyde dehydrogenase (NAD+)
MSATTVDDVDRSEPDGVEPFELVVGDGTIATEEIIDVVFPYTGATWATVPSATPDVVDAAVTAAHEAFVDDDWGGLTQTERGRLLGEVADAIDADAATLARLETLGNGKPVTSTLAQVHGLANRIRYYAGLADKIQGETIPVDRPGLRAHTQREPYGVVAAITPWNSPLALAGYKLGPALAAGNTVVLKPSEFTPVSSIRLAAVLREAGLPPGVVNVVTGDGTAGAALTSHPGVDAVSFTGGVETGRKVGRTAGERITPAVLELGGKSPNVVFPDADVDAAVEGAVTAIFAAAGQTCIAGSRLLLHESIHDTFVDQLVERAEAIRLGSPLDPATEMGPIATAPQFETIQRYVDVAREEGATVVTGGAPVSAEQLLYPPTVLTGVENDDTVACEEVFGPVLSVLTFEDEADALAKANDTEFGLAAAVWTENVRRANRLADRLEAGVVWLNTYRQLSFTTPFGGYKQSGVGRENGTEAIGEYVQTKTVWTETRPGSTDGA